MAISDPDPTVEAFREACKQALEENEQQEQLIDALLARAQGQRGIVEREPIEIGALTGEVLRARELDAAAHGLRIEASLDPVVIAGDRRLVERLISNLVENAIRNNVPSGQLEVRVKPRSSGSSVGVHYFRRSEPRGEGGSSRSRTAGRAFPPRSCSGGFSPSSA